MKQNILLLLLLMFSLAFSGCRDKNETKSLVFVDLTLFEVKGNGSSLNFPAFSQTISLDEMMRDVDMADYYHRKLSGLYDFKDFTYVTSGSWDALLTDTDKINNGTPIFSEYVPEDYRGRYEAEIVFSGYQYPVGEFVFRIAKGDDNGKKQIRHQKIELRNGQSASIGALYDAQKNRGFLYVISMSAVEITPDLTVDKFIEFLKQKNSFRRNPKGGMFSGNDRRWVKQLFGEEALKKLPEPVLNKSNIRFIPYDVPPRPKEPINPEYPESALKDSLEGTVILQTFINKSGRAEKINILRGVRDDLDRAAVSAIKKVSWEPAKSKEKQVSVWISIPVNFKLK